MVGEYISYSDKKEEKEEKEEMSRIYTIKESFKSFISKVLFGEIKQKLTKKKRKRGK